MHKDTPYETWCQEEPLNQGAWLCLRAQLQEVVPDIAVIARDDAAAPAVGYASKHRDQQADIIQRVFNEER